MEYQQQWLNYAIYLRFLQSTEANNKNIVHLKMTLQYFCGSIDATMLQHIYCYFADATRHYFSTRLNDKTIVFLQNRLDILNSPIYKAYYVWSQQHGEDDPTRNIRVKKIKCDLFDMITKTVNNPVYSNIK